MVFSLLYVSRNAVDPDRYGAEIDRIVKVSTARNADLAVTGALVATPLHFSQVLEGEREAIESLMESIAADPRHRDVAVIDTLTVPERAFARWSMAHVGPSPELEEAIAQAAERAEQGRLSGAEGWRLRSLIGELAYKQFRADRYRGLT